MSEYTINRIDAEPENRTRQSGHFCVKKNGRSTALFLFDYPESSSHLYDTEAEALAAAKSFMAIDDLVESLSKIASFAPGYGDVCEIIAQTARTALAKVDA